MSDLIIPDMSLCAIVRDEKMNPAGGIVDYVDSVMPFVEEGIIYDTGSLDGTRELLEEMQGKYPNLKVFDTPFRGFSNARNKSVKKAKTKYALVLDADERIIKDDFGILAGEIKKTQEAGYNLNIQHMGFYGNTHGHGGHNPRVFDRTRGFKFKKKVWEFLYDSDGKKVTNTSSAKNLEEVYLYHFLPDVDAREEKGKGWYEQIMKTGAFLPFRGVGAPSQMPGFENWKKRSPIRDDFIFGAQAV